MPIILLTASLLAAGGCRGPDTQGAPDDTQATPSRARRVDIRPLVEQPYSGLDSARRDVIRDSASWHSLWSRVGARMLPRPEAPAVEFGEEMVLVAALGRRRSGGYAVRIAEVYESDDRLYAVVEEVVPGAACMTTMALTSPVAAVAVPSSPHPIEFVERRITRDCEE